MNAAAAQRQPDAPPWRCTPTPRPATLAQLRTFLGALDITSRRSRRPDWP